MSTVPPETVTPSQDRTEGLADMADVDYISSRVLVLEAVQELYCQEISITTSMLMRVTGLRHVTVADCIKALKERGEIWSPARGVYLPVMKHPPARAVSRTALPDGTVKLEVGDDVLTLTPRESRMVAEAMGGTNTLIAAIESLNQIAEVASLIHRPQPSTQKTAVQNNRKLSWSKEDIALLGTMPDLEVAEKVGCAEYTVGRARRKFGIAAYDSGRVRGGPPK